MSLTSSSMSSPASKLSQRIGCVRPIKTLPMPAIAFSSAENDAPSAKLTLNITAFNGNKTNFGGNRNGNK